MKIKYNNIATIEEIIEETKKGKPVVIIDEVSRENEGDVIIPAQKITPEIINFMIKFARGLVCLAIDEKRAKILEIDRMPKKNVGKFNTDFTVSIDARYSITTGISAYDREITIKTAIDPEKNSQYITTPGHVFPIIAKKNGTIDRKGHTEAAYDIAKIAEMYPAGVICEIIKDDGKMARMDDLILFARKHQLKIGTIEDILEYRKKFNPKYHD